MERQIERINDLLFNTEIFRYLVFFDIDYCLRNYINIVYRYFQFFDVLLQA